MAYRVVQWSVGGVGRQALRALVDSTDFDLVGVFTHAERRTGRDVGDLLGLGIETGIRSTLGHRGAARPPSGLRRVHLGG